MVASVNVDNQQVKDGNCSWSRESSALDNQYCRWRAARSHLQTSLDSSMPTSTIMPLWSPSPSSLLNAAAVTVVNGLGDEKAQSRAIR